MNKNIYRNKRKKMIAGVAAGIADYFDIDPVIVRAAFIIATLAWGVSLLVYILLWIIIPTEEKAFQEEVQDDLYNSGVIDDDFKYHEKRKTREKRHNFFGIILIIIGTVFLLDKIFFIDFSDIWPLLLIGLGAYIIYKKRNPAWRI